MSALSPRVIREAQPNENENALVHDCALVGAVFRNPFPIYWLFVISVKPAVDLFTTPEVILKSVYWQNYIDIFGDETLRRYMYNSLIISSCNALLVTTLGFLACYALSRFDIPGKESVFFWTITNRMAPPAVFLLPLYLLLTQVYVWAISSWPIPRSA